MWTCNFCFQRNPVSIHPLPIKIVVQYRRKVVCKKGCMHMFCFYSLSVNNNLHLESKYVIEGVISKHLTDIFEKSRGFGTSQASMITLIY